MIPVGVIGASGYTGLELIRLLERHPVFQLKVITSRDLAGKSLGESFGFQGKYRELIFEEPIPEVIAEKVKAVFLCVPAGTAQELAFFFINRGIKVVDLSADFRFKNVELYQSTYKITHRYPQLIEKAVYGLSEIFAEEIKDAELIGNPGCYPTAILLPLIPLIKGGLIEGNNIIVDAKSGTSGAGRKVETYYSFCEVNEDFKAYKVASHRHTPEMEEKLTFFAGHRVSVVFTPHLLPINRGILATIYVKYKASLESLHSYLRDFYRNTPFVEVLPLGSYPRISEVRGTNSCKISLFEDKERAQGIIISVIDNLAKGASGQAIQNLNLMFGLPEDMGLPQNPLFV
ncbi:MAG: N-acetyl-gamma-glutamyl-phosphate reductase [Caldimicrobium sp.]|nr:N-acetyl-gamma-glutamyl-phosphate reductase [Caldimicrobium sp.]MCX7873812.1 N-acetyl-gamma-glutamyl-phosphate reductase [Caldimicrobium sp.]MDW8094648.1 N-acetyl-gamma-glutamyl-phosphate reductase [Caldimicrobium sp.]